MVLYAFFVKNYQISQYLLYLFPHDFAVYL